ncbi:Zinc finger BED domain-containing protein RICESLEEPER 2, partial [Bienertia sinuspersici]
MSRHLINEHGLELKGEESSSGRQAQLHGYASDMPGAGMPFVYNRERMIIKFGKFVIADELPFSFGESPNFEYFDRVALQPQYRRVHRNTLKSHTQQAYYAYRGYIMKMFHTYHEYGLRKKVISLDTPIRWNSTYQLLHDAITYRDVFTDMYNESRIDGRFITNYHWSLAKIIHDILETFDNATHIFSCVYEANIHMVILECIKIICTIKQTSMANPDPSVKDLLDNMKVKWCAYFNELPPIYVIAAILDPSVKLQGLTNLLTFSNEQLGVNFDVPSYVNKYKLILERLCQDYGAMIQPQPVGFSTGTSRSRFIGPILKKRPHGSGPSLSSSSSSSLN